MPGRKTAAIIGAAAAAFPASAYAYIDPGTGSLALQALIGAVAGGLFAARMWWARIASFFGGARKNAATDADPNADNPTP
ncbi:MAG: hypothetical protein HXY21_10790 [Parvularculaceae bacterium]|nr:hypothetical protein [Parvularculaceae bacterium]